MTAIIDINLFLPDFCKFVVIYLLIMLNFIKKQFRKNRITEDMLVADRQYLDWSHIKSVSFAYLMDSVQSAAELAALLSAFDKFGVDYRGLIIEGEKGLFARHKMENNRITLLRRTDINWLGIPKNSIVKNFTCKESDIFICFNGANNYTLNYICQLENSGFKVALGNGFDSNLFTMVLKQPDGARYSAVEMFGKLRGYLEMIKTEPVNGK